MMPSDHLHGARLCLALMEKLQRREDGGSVVLVTSAAPGEGKSFVSRLLGRCLAELDEGDIGLVSTVTADGLNKVTESDDKADADLFGLMRGEPVAKVSERLFQVPAGSGLRSTAFFRSAGVARAVTALRQRFSLSLIDGCVLADCGALLRQVDAVLLVVDSRRTAPSVIQRSLDRAGIAASDISGVILNHAPMHTPSRMDGH